MTKNRSKVDKMPVLELVLKMHGQMMKNLASGYSETVVSHWRGCIFQGFQRLQKNGKATSEIVSKCLQNPLKSGSEGSQKRSLKIQGQTQRT